MNTKDCKEKLAHLSYLQKKGGSESANRQIASEMGETIIAHNDARTEEIRRETQRQSSDCHLDSAKDLFNRHEKGRKYV